MNPKIVKEELEAKPFEPFVVVTASGDRYLVRHPELAVLASRALYVFERGPGDEIDGPVKIGYANITALEPIPEKAA